MSRDRRTSPAREEFYTVAPATVESNARYGLPWFEQRWASTQLSLFLIGGVMIAIQRPVVRETNVRERGRSIVVELHASYLTLRLKGLRERHVLAYDALHWRAHKAEAERIRLEKAQATRQRARK